MNMTPEKAKELMDNATPSPWDSDDHGCYVTESDGNPVVEMRGWGKLTNIMSDSDAVKQQVDNGKFIAALPEITKLCLSQADELNKLKAHNARLREALDMAVNGIKWHIENSDDANGCDEDALNEINEVLKQGEEQSLQAIKDERSDEIK